jgi:hypothetical protein
MQQFIRKRQADVMGVLSGFDRIRFRGTLRWLATVPGLRRFLWAVYGAKIFFTLRVR